MGARDDFSNGRRRWARPSLLAVVVVGLVAAVSPDVGAFSHLRRDAWYPLLERTLTLYGPQSGDQVGTALAGLKNFAGDGQSLVAVGAPGFSPTGRSHAGAVFLRPPRAAGKVTLTAAAGTGTSVIGSARGDELGASVADAGDVNGDGLEDLVVGAPGASFGGRTHAGAAYVIFGGRTPQTIDTAGLGAAGFAIGGASAGDRTGLSVSGVGDVNGDGYDDVLIGAPGASPHGRTGAGRAYVVYGRPGVEPVDLGSPGSDAVAFDGGHAGDAAGASVGSARGFAATGRPAALIGAPGQTADGMAGAIYVVEGFSSGLDADLGRLGSRGVTLLGARGRTIGAAVAGAGDTNGDGLDDIVAGAPQADIGHRDGAGAAYVVFGRRPTGRIRLARLGNRGFLVQGAGGLDRTRSRPGDQAGTSVAAAGDIDGDGLADVLIGAPEAHDNLDGRGGAWVVYGQRDHATVTLTQVGGRALRVLDSQGAEGPSARGNILLGQAVAGVGDVTGDGLGDLLLGAPLARVGVPSDDGTHSGGMVVLLQAPRLQISHGSRLADTSHVDVEMRCLSPTARCSGTLVMRGATHRRCGGRDLFGVGLAQGGFAIGPRSWARVHVPLTSFARRVISCARGIEATAEAHFGANGRTTAGRVSFAPDSGGVRGPG